MFLKTIEKTDEITGKHRKMRKDRNGNVFLSHREQGFSLNHTICAANVFSNAYQLSYCIFDLDMNILHQSRSKRMKCPVCAFLKEYMGQPMQNDLVFHQKACQQAKNLSGWYLYACPLGVQFFSVPVWNDDNEIVAYIVAGPITLRGLKDRNLFDSIKRRNLPVTVQDSFFQILREFPFLLLREIESLARKLQMISRCLQKSKEPLLMQAIRVTPQFLAPGDLLLTDDWKRQLFDAFFNADQSLNNKILLNVLDWMYIEHRGIAQNMHAGIIELMTLLTQYALSCGISLRILLMTSYEMISVVCHIQSFYQLSTWILKTADWMIHEIKSTAEVKNMVTIRQAMKFICYHDAKKIALEDVAGAVYLSPTYFCKVFHHVTKCSFSVYINYMRVERSKGLLLSTKSSITEIAKSIGFEDQSYFTKVFKRTTGVTPGVYRRAVPKRTYTASALEDQHT